MQKHEQTQPATSKARRSVLILWLVAFSVPLALTTVFLGPIAAVAGVAIILWVALFRVWRTLKRERWQLAGRLEQQRRRYDATISVLLSALELREDVTNTQMHRTRDLVTIVAGQMGLGRNDVCLVQKAAILHDVGKIGISEAVLSKRGAFTEEEWAAMRRHPEVGARVLSSIDMFSDIAELVHAHHERFDGQGYPRRLRGQEIPLASRIFAVVDAYVAMTSPRPYRKTMPHDLAVKEIVRNSLTQFDPEVVRAFMAAEQRGLISPATPRPDGQRPDVPVGAEA